LASKASRDKAPSVLMIVVRTISTMNKGTLWQMFKKWHFTLQQKVFYFLLFWVSIYQSKQTSSYKPSTKDKTLIH
jgi:hypothetical protein